MQFNWVKRNRSKNYNSNTTAGNTQRVEFSCGCVSGTWKESGKRCVLFYFAYPAVCFSFRLSMTAWIKKNNKQTNKQNRSDRISPGNRKKCLSLLWKRSLDVVRWLKGLTGRREKELEQMSRQLPPINGGINEGIKRIGKTLPRALVASLLRGSTRRCQCQQ